MNIPSTYPLPGLYHYSYPTFVDTPQQICVHFYTPDHQRVFVTYPNYRTAKAAQLVALSWFDSVILVPLDGQPQLMHFLEVTLSEWFTTSCSTVIPAAGLASGREAYTFHTVQAA